MEDRYIMGYIKTKSTYGIGIQTAYVKVRCPGLVETDTSGTGRMIEGKQTLIIIAFL